MSKLYSGTQVTVREHDAGHQGIGEWVIVPTSKHLQSMRKNEWELIFVRRDRVSGTARHFDGTGSLRSGARATVRWSYIGVDGPGEWVVKRYHMSGGSLRRRPDWELVWVPQEHEVVEEDNSKTPVRRSPARKAPAPAARKAAAGSANRRPTAKKAPAKAAAKKAPAKAVPAKANGRKNGERKAA